MDSEPGTRCAVSVPPRCAMIRHETSPVRFFSPVVGHYKAGAYRWKIQTHGKSSRPCEVRHLYHIRFLLSLLVFPQITVPKVVGKDAAGVPHGLMDSSTDVECRK